MFRPAFRLLATCAALALVPAHPALAESPPEIPVPPQSLTFDRVFASPSLNGPVPSNVKLSPDGRFLTLLRNRADDRERWDLWAFDRQAGGGQAGDWRMLVDSLRLGSGRELSEAEKMQRERQRIGDAKGIVRYDWAADGQSLLVPLDGELFRASIDGTVAKLPVGEGDLLNAALSPRGGYLSFVRDRRLWIGAGEAQPQPVTPEEASQTVHWGEAEFVAQEEMGRMQGAWWAPDDSRIAVQRFDEAKVGVVTRAAIGAEGTETFQQRYPVAGSANAEVSLHVMLPDGSGRVEVDLGADRDIYLARVDWAADAKTLYVQRQDRGQQRLDMLAVDPATGAARVLFTETAAAGHWINLSDNYRFLRDGSLIWWSERDGFGHLWHFKAGKWRQLTRGAWVVTKLVGVDEDTGRVTFLANRDDVLAEQIYALALADPRRIEVLGEPGFVHAATMDKAGQTMVVTRSAPAQPPQVYVAGADGRRLAWVEENRVEGAHPYAPWLAGHAMPRFGTIRAADGSDLHWRMIAPPLVPGKRYPVLFSHYGGPTVQVVTRGWTGALAQAIVDRGFIFFEIDNRGSDNRGVAFARQINRAMGGVEVADQLAGLRFLKSLPHVDGSRIATYGWSYGGYMTLKMLQANPGDYAAGISGAPVTRWELYDTHYTERYLGDPGKEPESYARSNALADAAKIRDPLLLIHGMADDNVVFENSSALIAKLQGEAVPFEMMLYPGQTHRVGGPKVSVHLWNAIFAFLERHGIAPDE